jgi:hypothetical protein
MVSPTSERTLVYLRRAGYGVIFRIQGWAECLVSLAEERWVGHGETEGESLDDALRQMLPSRLARSAFEAQIRGPIDAPAPGVVDEPAPSSAPGLDATVAPAAPITSATSEPIEAAALPEHPAVAEALEAPPSTTVEAVAAPPPVEPAAVAPLAAEKAIEPPPPEARIDSAANAVRLAEALAALDGMLHDIDAQLPKLAKKCAERQRFQLLGWICRARAYEESLPEARAVTAAVQRIARRLSEIGKMLWPGSVRALQLATAPADTMESHALDAPPATWAEATERAEQRYREHIRKATSAGFDDDGWIDAHPVGAAPTDPDALLAQALKDLDALLARPGDGPAEDQDSSAIVRIAQTLRWVRVSAQDHVSWGLAMGRLRRVSMAPGTSNILLRKTIDPAFRPSSSWLPVVAPPSESALLEESAAKLRADLAQLVAGEDTLLPWLIRAFDVFPTPALAELVRSRRSQIMALSEIAATYEDRRIRRRMRDLIQRLGAGGADETPASARREIAAAAKEKEEEAESESEDDSALQKLCDSVRMHTEGRRVLFASNRSDAKLEARLTELLGVKMAGCDGGPRRVQSQCERIAQGSYDLVLSATGFQDHAVDGALAHAASVAGIPYVRVNRGRPLACAQAIVRELGKLPAGEAPGRPALRVG